MVISSTLHQLLDTFFESESLDQFVQKVQKEFNLSYDECNTYFNEINHFLEEVYIPENSNQPKLGNSAISIPSSIISKTYCFGVVSVKVNYSSQKVLQLIHPYLQHASKDNFATYHHTFDIFHDQEFIYLFKNSTYVGVYKKNQFHFLQGKFAMELTSALYDNSESDWMATFHASTVCNDKEAIMIVGDSGSGKSTLSALLMGNGLDLLADDFTPMLAENQNLCRFPAAISIKENSFPLISSIYEGFDKQNLNVSTSKSINVKFLPPSKEFSSSQKQFRCNKVVQVKYSSDFEGAVLTSCSSEIILQTLIPDSWVSPNPTHAEYFLNWLSGLQFFQLNYSDNELAIEKFKDLFID